jgi:uncharacterized protein (TIGR02099 family)
MTTPKSSPFARWGGLLATLAIVLTCLSAVSYASARYLLWPRLDAWRPQIAAQLERRIGQPVSIGALHPDWQDWAPSLSIDDLRLMSAEGELHLLLTSARGSIDLRSLLHGAPTFSQLRLERPVVVVERLAGNRIMVAGRILDNSNTALQSAIAWLLQQDGLAIQDLSVRFVDRGGALASRQLGGIDLDLRNHGLHHQVLASLERPAAGLEAFRAVLDFRRPDHQAAGDWNRWKGDAYLSLTGLKLADFDAIALATNPSLPSAVATATGLIDQLAWAAFDKGALIEASTRLQASPLAIDLEAGHLDLQSLEAHAQLARRAEGGYRLQVTKLSASDRHGFSMAISGDADMTLDGRGRLQTARALLAPIDAAVALAAVRRQALAAPLAQRLRPWQVAGNVRDLDLQWGPRPDGSAGLEARAIFELLELRHRPAGSSGKAGSADAQGFSGLSGSLRMTPVGGKVMLQSRDATFFVPPAMALEPIGFSRLEGEFGWRRAGEDGRPRLSISVPSMRFANADAAGEVRADWREQPSGPGRLAMSGMLDRLDARKVERYLPRPLPESLRNWLREAIPGGRAEQVGFSLEGDLRDFPFRRLEQGHFRVAGRLSDVTLAFLPEWHAIDQISATLTIDRVAVLIDATSGRMGKVRLSDVRTRISDYSAAVVKIDGRALGAAHDMLAVVETSPVGPGVASFARSLEIDGNAALDLGLSVPLDAVSLTTIAGHLELPGNDVRIDHTLVDLKGLQGSLNFDERSLKQADLRASALGGPIRIQARSGESGRTLVEATGSFDAAGIRQVVDNALTRRIAGGTDYRAIVDIGAHDSTLQFDSDLVGLVSSLPAPFAKEAAEAWSLRLVSHPIAATTQAGRPSKAASAGDRIDLTLGNTAAMSVERERDAGSDRMMIRRGAVAFGAEPVLRDTGLSVLVRGSDLDLDVWRNLLSDSELDRMKKSGGDRLISGMSIVPEFVSVVVDKLRVGGQRLHDVVFGASRQAERWQANIASREVEGYLSWIDAVAGQRTGTIEGQLDRLILPRSRESEVESALSVTSSMLPGLKLKVSRLVLGEVELGRVGLDATNRGTAARPVWDIDRLTLDNSDSRVTGRGTWVMTPAAISPSTDTSLSVIPDEASRGTTLDFSIDIVDAGALLTRVGVKDAIKGGSGTFGGKVQWRGSPFDIDVQTLSGDLQLSLGEGAFLRVDPGAAKLISVLSLSALPKRLTGDFRDVFGAGFAFDTIRGSLAIENGIARTDDLIMHGTQANVTLRGEADLSRETQRLRVEVVPEVNAGLAAVAVGAMINPVLGLGTLAAQYVLRGPLQQALAVDVDISGSWADPEVRERSRRAPVNPARDPLQ